MIPLVRQVMTKEAFLNAPIWKKLFRTPNMVQNTYLGKMDARDQPSQKTNANMIMNKVIVNTQDLRLSYRLASLRLQALNKADSFQVPSFLKNTYYRENLPNVSRCISARDS